MTIKEAMLEIEQLFIGLYGEDIVDIRLEEISTAFSDNCRDITVSFLLPERNPITGFASAMIPAANKKYDRLFKTVRINMETKEVLQIRIYKE